MKWGGGMEWGGVMKWGGGMEWGGVWSECCTCVVCVMLSA